jgi:5-oxoprolinase (ATP-hydrolysing) subunit A
MLTIDLNCDMGESTALWQYDLEKDKSLLPFITSMNLACGFHAGDAFTMHELTEAALLAGVAVGAHPGFPDREDFGRMNMNLSSQEIYDIVLYQIGALSAFLKVRGARLHHVKPHGALYNMAAKDESIAAAICKAVIDFDNRLLLYGLSGSKLIEQAKAVGLPTCSEVFADRTYQDDGSLTSRMEANALVEDTGKAIEQVLNMVTKSTVTSVNGNRVHIDAETICIHSDGKQVLEFAGAINTVLKEHEIMVVYPDLGN